MSLVSTLRFITRHPLNRDRKFKALLRYLVWQLTCRTLPSAKVINFANDSKLLIRAGMTGATGNLYCGLHEFEHMGFLLHFLREEDLFFDIGANVGSYTVLASAAIGCRSLSVEPIPMTYEALKKNIELNEVAELVDCRNIGVGSEHGELFFTCELDTVNHVVSDKDRFERSVRVPVLSLDDLYTSRPPTLVKIDVEGFEAKVIDGAGRLFENPGLQALIVELNGSGKRYGFDDEKTHQSITAHGFSPYSYDPLNRGLTQQNARNLHGNTLYVRNLGEVSERLINAPKFSVLDHTI